MTAKITYAELEAKGACADQLALFRQLFGEETTVTLAKARRVANKFDWVWAARHLLSDKALAEYKHVRAAAWAEYEHVRAAALAEYQRVEAAAWAEYEHVTAAAWAEYERVKAPARAEYERVKAAAWAEYERVKAAAFVTGWKADR